MEAGFAEAQAIREKTLGPEHLAVAQTKFSLGLALWRGGRPAEAEPLLRQTLAFDRRDKKEPDAPLLWASNALGRMKAELGDLDGLEASFKEALAIAPKVAEATHLHHL